MLTIRKRSIYLLTLSLPLLLVILVFISYIFTESAAILLLLLLLLILLFATILSPIKTSSLELTYSHPVLLQLLFIVYWAMRADAGGSDAYGIVFEQILYLLIFTVAAIYSNNNKPNTIISFIAAFYLLAFIICVSMEFTESREGYNLWSGFVIFTLTPLILMYKSDAN